VLKLSPLKSESTTFLRLDLLRFIAAIGIVAFHVTDDRRVGLNLFVDMFFVISGIVITHVYGEKIETPQRIGKFLWARIARLGPLHWATLAFFVALNVAGELRHGTTIPDRWSCFWPNVFFLQATGICTAAGFNYVSWSISAEMFVYLLFPFIALFGRRLGAIALLGISAVMLASLYLVGSTNPPWWEWSAHFGALRALPAFCFGSAIYLLRDRLARLAVPGLAGVALVGFAVGIFVGVPKPVLVAFVYAVPFLALSADTKFAPSSRLIEFAGLGQLTYSIYMLHPCVLALARNGGKGLPALDAHALTIAAALAVLPLSYASLIWFETPTRRWLNGLPKALRDRGLTAAAEG
jgi:peptidoglycan/LPS O-acetylase OafA/YrhL